LIGQQVAPVVSIVFDDGVDAIGIEGDVPFDLLDGIKRGFIRPDRIDRALTPFGDGEIGGLALVRAVTYRV
jgi:hypothetical protein